MRHTPSIRQKRRPFFAILHNTSTQTVLASTNATFVMAGNLSRARIVFLSLLASAILLVLNAKNSFTGYITLSTQNAIFDAGIPQPDNINEVSNNNRSDGTTLVSSAVIPVIRISEEIVVNPAVIANFTETHTHTQSTSTSSSSTSSSSTAGDSPPKTNKPLNVVIFYPDDLRHDSLGCAGTQPVMTPFLDSLASDGIRFVNNTVTTSICWVSRATLFSGQYLSRHKSETLKRAYFCDPEKWNSSWPYLLQKAGYWVGHSGKWQFYNGGFVYDSFNWTSLHEGRHWYPMKGGGRNGKPKYQHACDKSEEEVIQFIKDRPKDRPFAVTVAYYPPKAIGSGPVQWFPKNETKALYENMTIPEPYKWNECWWRLPEFFRPRNEARIRWKQRFGTYELYQNSMKCYYALITEVDKACEHIVDELKRQGIYENTMIIFTADNGFFHGEHGLAGKWYPYHESIRVPLIIRDPRMPKEKRGTLDNSFTLNIDLASTILGAANLPSADVMQGRNIADIYLTPDGKSTWRKEFYYEHMSMGKRYIPASSALVRKDYKYMFYREWQVEHLFDMINDPLEINDLSNMSEYKQLLGEMRKRHNELKEEVK